MDKIEKKQCEKVIDLFGDAIKLKEDFHYAYINDVGFAFLEYVGQDGLVEQAYVYKSAKEIFAYFMENWQYDFINQYMESCGISEFQFEEVIKSLPEEVRIEMEQKEIGYKNSEIYKELNLE